VCPGHHRSQRRWSINQGPFGLSANRGRALRDVRPTCFLGELVPEIRMGDGDQGFGAIAKALPEILTCARVVSGPERAEVPARG
jgi:hypothetical protein